MTEGGREILQRPMTLLALCFTLLSCMAYSPIQKMEATCSSETSVNLQRSTRRYIPEDRTLHNHRCDTLKSCKTVIVRLNFVWIHRDWGKITILCTGVHHWAQKSKGLKLEHLYEWSKLRMRVVIPQLPDMQRGPKTYSLFDSHYLWNKVTRSYYCCAVL
jgi:hypothetical protein